MPAHRKRSSVRCTSATSAQTYRDVRRDARKAASGALSGYNDSLRESSRELVSTKRFYAVQIKGLRHESERVLDKGQAGEYANYLVALRRLEEQLEELEGELLAQHKRRRR